ncbi:hypothetical protein CL616_00685 [archaeon]|nr:hypothetical protein [archaeon]
MKFQVKKKERKSVDYPHEEYEIAKTFAKRVYQEFGQFVKAIVLFGSTVKKTKAQDIDILIVLDDLSIDFTEDVVQTYRVIIQKIMADTDPKRLHIQTMKFTSFWEYVRVGDPVAVNILRYGLALIDTGFFDPMQALLDEGRIRPSEESIATYFAMAPASVHRAKQHMLSAGVDLYWAVIDSAHAALMRHGAVPPSPDHVADIMEQTLIKEKKVSRKSASIMREFYGLFKDITSRRRRDLSGKEYDSYKKKAEEFVKEMEKIVKKK